jgi:hypothetical protein
METRLWKLPVPVCGGQLNTRKARCIHVVLLRVLVFLQEDSLYMRQ